MLWAVRDVKNRAAAIIILFGSKVRFCRSRATLFWSDGNAALKHGLCADLGLYYRTSQSYSLLWLCCECIGKEFSKLHWSQTTLSTSASHKFSRCVKLCGYIKSSVATLKFYQRPNFRCCNHMNIAGITSPRVTGLMVNSAQEAQRLYPSLELMSWMPYCWGNKQFPTQG